MFAPVRVSDAGNYSCSVTIVSTYLTRVITLVASHGVRIQRELKLKLLVMLLHDIVCICAVPVPSSITLTSSEDNSIRIIQSGVILTCAVELDPAIRSSEIFLLIVDTRLSRDGTPLPLTGPTVTGTTFTYTTQLNSFGSSDFGNYTCTSTIRPRPSLTYLTGIDILSEMLVLKIGRIRHTIIIVL